MRVIDLFHYRRNDNGEWCTLPNYKSALKGNVLHQYARFVHALEWLNEWNKEKK